MSEQGTIAVVSVATAGSELADVANTGSTALSVVVGVDFPEPGGQVRIDGDTLAVTGVVEATEPDGADTLVLAAATTRPYEAGERVDVWPLVPQKTALVTLLSQDDAVAVRVPHALDALVPEGVRDTAAGESVTIEVDRGEWVLADVVGKAPSLDGSAINPATTIPPAALTDGLAPSAAPAPALRPFAIGGLEVSWAPVPNPDPVTYRVWMHTATPVPTDDEHLVARTSATRTVVSALGDGATIAYDTDYYAVVAAADADGVGPASATVGPTRARQATNEDVSAEFVYAGSLEAIIAQIDRLSILSDQLGAVRIAQGGSLDVGDRIRLGSASEDDPNGDSITIFARTDVDGQKVPLVTLSPDGSTFRGRVIADDVSVLNGLELMGTMSKLKPGAWLTFENGINDPQVKPALTNSLRTVPFQAPSTLGVGLVYRNIFWEASTSRWHVLGWRAGTRQAYVWQFDASGVFVPGSGIELSPGSYPHANISGLVKAADSYWAFARTDRGNGDGFSWQPVRYSLTGAIQARGAYEFDSPAAEYPVMGLDSNGAILAAGHGAVDGDGVVIQRYLPSAGADFSTASAMYCFPTRTDGTVERATQGGVPLSFVGQGNFDFGAARIVLHWGTTTKVYATPAGFFSDSYAELDATEITAQSWTHESRIPFGWRTDLGVFQGTSQTVGGAVQWGSYYPSASERLSIAYAYSDGTRSTRSSPVESIALAKRMYVAIGAPIDLPSGVTQARLYSRGGTATTQASTALRLRTETVTPSSPSPVLLAYAPAVRGPETGAAPPTTNTFPTGNPGGMRSDVSVAQGGWQLDGAGGQKLPALVPTLEEITAVTTGFTSTTPADIPGLSVTKTLKATQKLSLRAFMDLNASGASVGGLVRMVINGVTRSGEIRALLAQSDRGMHAGEWAYTIPADGDYVIKMQAATYTGTGQFNVTGTNSKLVIETFAPIV